MTVSFVFYFLAQEWVAGRRRLERRYRRRYGGSRSLSLFLSRDGVSLPVADVKGGVHGEGGDEAGLRHGGAKRERDGEGDEHRGDVFFVETQTLGDPLGPVELPVVVDAAVVVAVVVVAVAAAVAVAGFLAGRLPIARCSG